MKLTKYGPGKFSHLIDSAVYSMSLHGPDEELGDVDGFGHYSTVDGPISAKDLREVTGETYSDLSADDLEYLARAKGGAIIEENCQGFVTVDYFGTVEDREEQWSKIEAAYDRFEEYPGDAADAAYEELGN